MTRISPLLLLLAASLASAVLPAQEPFLEISGLNDWDRLGHSIAILDDVNGDGHDDLVTTADGNRNPDLIQVWSGADGSLLWELWTDPLGPWLNSAADGLVSLGDLDGDGAGDFALEGGPIGGLGGVLALSGTTGAVIWQWEPTSSEYLKEQVSGGDVDGDGFPDLLVGGSLYSGPDLVFVLSGLTGNHLYTISADQDPSWATISFSDKAMAFLGDLDGDGRDDFAVGAPYSDINGRNSGLVLVFSGADGSVIREIPGPPSPGGPDEPRFGGGILGPGDVNADGLPDLVVRTLGYPVTSAGSGGVSVLSGADLSILYSFQGDEVNHGLGSPVGDVNQDGFADFGIGHVYRSGWVVVASHYVIHSGKDGGRIALLAKAIIETSSAGGDLNADGRPDFAFAETIAGPKQRGKVTVAPLAPWLEAGPVVAGQTATVDARAFHAGYPAALVASLTGPGSTWFPTWEVMLDLANPVALAGPTTTDATGAVSWTVPVPAGAAGVPVWLQAVQQWHRSNVVAVVVQ